MQPFRKTQFGYEANPGCLGGRPFLDSITPVPVDPVNPYLSFKLKDVDVIQVPEDRFHQVSNDPDITVLPGPRYFLYLKSSGLTEEQMAQITASIDVKELSRTVLNDHVDILFSSPVLVTSTMRPAILFSYPSEDPYRLLGERIAIQLKGSGFPVSQTGAPNMPELRLFASPIVESDLDLFRYHLLKARPGSDDPRPWYEQWDDLEGSGKLVPLLIHITRIAARKSLLDLQIRSNGMPDFANWWLLQTP